MRKRRGTGDEKSKTLPQEELGAGRGGAGGYLSKRSKESIRSHLLSRSVEFLVQSRQLTLVPGQLVLLVLPRILELFECSCCFNKLVSTTVQFSSAPHREAAGQGRAGQGRATSEKKKARAGKSATTRQQRQGAQYFYRTPFSPMLGISWTMNKTGTFDFDNCWVHTLRGNSNSGILGGRRISLLLYKQYTSLGMTTNDRLED